MKKLVLAGPFAALVAIGPAYAADLQPSIPAYKAPVAAPAYNWTGLYVGANAGYAWMDSTDTIVGADAPSATFLANTGTGTPLPLSSSGFLAGGQLGYNWQIGSGWVVGIETDIQWANLNSTTSLASALEPARVMTANEKLDLFGTLRGRVGVLATDQFLAYVTGGLAYGHASLSTALTNTTGCVLGGGGANNCEQGSVSATLIGWTAGGGVEWAFATRWSAKAEYLYYDLGTLTHTMTDPNFPFVFNASADVKGNVVRAGINFKID